MRSALLAIAMLCVATPAHAEDHWTWESDDPDVRADARVRFALNINIWVSTYNRPANTACLPNAGVGGFALRAAQVITPVDPPSFSFCNNEASDETGVGPGIDVQFRALGPLYLTAGLDVFYTEPGYGISNQWVIAVPFGLRLTWPHWWIRPIAEALITPVLYITDDARDYTLGARGGFALRLGDSGDLSLLIGYQTAETLDNISVTLGFTPIL